jgi:hypothetical protein
MKLTEEQRRILDEIVKEKGFDYQYQAQDYLCGLHTGKQIVGKGLPQKCQTCDFHGKLYNGKVYCFLKVENQLPKYVKFSLIEAEACSTVPTLITMARKEELMQEISNRRQMENHWKAEVDKLRTEKQLEIEKVKKPIEALLTQKSTLESRVCSMENTLLESRNTIGLLETDNEQLRRENALLSESELLKENDDLHLEVKGKDKLIDANTNEIKKSEALSDRRKQTLTEVISQTKTTFRDLKQDIPTWLTTYDQLLKKIDDFLGYLETVSSSS